MATVKDIYRSLDQWAAFSTQMEFDNAGFLVGYGDRTVRSALISLDITPEVVKEAEALGGGRR